MPRLVALVLCIVVVAGEVSADGSLMTQEIMVLLRQKPELSQPFLAAFELSESAIGVRLGPHFRYLGAARIGPYEISARPRGSTGAFNLRVWVCTQPVFVDQGEQPVEMTEATRVKETLSGFVVQPEGGKLECSP